VKIAHLCLSCFYVDGVAYQENELVSQNLADGHDVLVVASTEQIRPDGSLFYSSPGSYLGTDGAPVVRLPYRGVLAHSLARKVRSYPGLYEILQSFAPDVILFHGACSASMHTVAKYVRRNPETTLYVDSHEDFINSARTLLSKWGLHFLLYRTILRRSLDQISKILPVSVSCHEFMRDFYGVPEDKLEFYPLGGHVPEDDEYGTLRSEVRARLGLSDENVLIVQSGKLDRSKKLLEALKAFSLQDDPRLRFAIAGYVHPSIGPQVSELMACDPRIRELGWQSSEDLRALLCAADVYCQPGTQSATMQMAICCRCAIILDDIASHEPYLDGNGWLVSGEHELRSVLRELPEDVHRLPEMAARSHQLALRMLDYRLLAARIYR
jgi:glycosyltransferase involved in cell wall biosynthesis